MLPRRRLTSQHWLFNGVAWGWPASKRNAAGSARHCIAPDNHPPEAASLWGDLKTADEDRPMLDWVGAVAVATLLQVALFGGAFLALGASLHKLEQGTCSALSRPFGHRAVIYTTGWLGVPVHELSHLLMCLVFRHRVTEVALFKPDYNSNVLGYVNFSHDPHSPYQTVGLFFAGVAPLLGGGALLVALFILLFPISGGQVLSLFNVPSGSGLTFQHSVALLVEPSTAILQILFNIQNLLRWEFWVFLYASIAISSHMAPSRQDMKGTGPGLAVIVFLLMAFNGFGIAAGWHLLADWMIIAKYAVAVAGFCAMAVSLSLVNYLIANALAQVHQRAGMLRKA
jgi:hypothetical protein